MFQVAQFCSPFASWNVDPEEAMPQVVFVSVVADAAEIVVETFGTFPPYSVDRGLMTGVAHCCVMSKALNKF